MGTIKNLKWIGTFVLLLALWVGWYSTKKHAFANADRHTMPRESRGLVPPAATHVPASSPNTGPVRVRKDASTRSREEIMRDLHDAAVTYDAAQLPVIRPYLTHSDPAIRAAAANAMVVLGDASAAPMLRDAARSFGSSDEAKSLEKKAAYLELPPASSEEMTSDLPRTGSP